MCERIALPGHESNVSSELFDASRRVYAIDPIGNIKLTYRWKLFRSNAQFNRLSRDGEMQCRYQRALIRCNDKLILVGAKPNKPALRSTLCRSDCSGSRISGRVRAGCRLFCGQLPGIEITGCR